MKAEKNENNGEEKLDDILRSIRGMIENEKGNDEAILELTDELVEKENILSKETINKASAIIQDYVKKLDVNGYSKNDSNLDIVITELMKPLLREWMDDNLPRLLEKVIAQEFKRLVRKNG